ncbi:MAG: hypothetical protein ACREMX_10250 [Gemmatimonadales bacterium]
MSDGMSRREFAVSLALAALVPVLGVGTAPVRLAWWEAVGRDAAAEEPGALAKALAEAIRAQYGSRISEADLATITRQIQSGLERVEKIRKVELANGDEPHFTFSATPRGSYG